MNIGDFVSAGVCYGTYPDHAECGSDIRLMPAFGLGMLPLAHGPNECVATEAIIQASQRYALAALAYLDGDRQTDDK